MGSDCISSWSLLIFLLFITNFRFADDIVVNAEEEEEVASW